MSSTYPYEDAKKKYAGYAQHYEVNEEDVEDTSGKLKSHRKNAFKKFILKYSQNPLTLPILLFLVLVIISFDLYPSTSGTSLLDPFLGNSIDPQTYDFFSPTQQNFNLYKKINDFISPNHEPIGFQDDKFQRARTTPGAPPIIKNPGIYPLNNMDDTDEESKRITEIAKSYQGFSGFLWYVFTLGGRLSNNQLPKRQIYIILGSSQNIGIEREMSRQDWLIEKISILNKKEYAKRHNYQLIFQNSYNDVSLAVRSNTLDAFSAHKKKYQHENREGWERFDTIRQVMRTHSYNNDRVEEWYWYLDLHTLIMQPERSLEEVVFSLIEKASRSGAFLYNPEGLDNIKDSELTWSTLAHRREFNRFDLDPETSKFTHKDIDLILTQDCYGLNLGSFLIRRSKWSELLLDMLWEPVIYRQMHSEWNKLERKDLPNKYGFLLNEGDEKKEAFRGDESEMEERNCLEYFLTTQAWLRTRTAVLPTRVFNSLSNDSCVIDPESTLDLIDMEMDDDLIDALLGSDDIDLLAITEKLAANVASNKFREITSGVLDLHYEPSDFVYSFAACRGDCEKRIRDGMTWFKDIHSKQIFDV